MNSLIKFLITLIFLLLIGVGIFIAKLFYFDDSKDEQSKGTKKEEVLDENKVKKINDSYEQRDERIKALKEVGKKLGG